MKLSLCPTHFEDMGMLNQDFRPANSVPRGYHHKSQSLVTLRSCSHRRELHCTLTETLIKHRTKYVTRSETFRYLKNVPPTFHSFLDLILIRRDPTASLHNYKTPTDFMLTSIIHIVPG